MIGFTKSFFSKQVNKVSTIDSDELEYGVVNFDGASYAEKVAVKGLTFEQMKMMYISNVWVRSIIDKIVERVSEITPIVKPVKQRADVDTENVGKLDEKTKENMDTISKFLIEPNGNLETLSDIRKKLTRDLLVYDAGALEILRGANLAEGNKLIEIYNVPGNTVKINADKKGILPDDDAYVQVDRYLRKITSWKKNQIMYMKLNPQSDRLYGLSPLESLIQTVTADLYSSQYNLDFFYNNATPRFAVLMEGLGIGQGASALQRFRSWWDNELRGNPHRPIIIGTEQGKIAFEKVGLSNEEMQFQEYSKMLLIKIMTIFKMQAVVLGVDLGNAAKGTVAEQVKQFKIDAIKPQTTLFIDKMNKQVIFEKSAFGMKDVYLDYDLGIVDKKEQAEWHDKYLQNGVITINEIRTQGLGMLPVPWGNVPYLQNNLVPFGAGKNGQSLPGDASSVILDGQEGNVPNVNLVNRKLLLKYLTNDGTPIGWENAEPSERLKIVEQLIKDREYFLSKVYSFPKNKVTTVAK